MSDIKISAAGVYDIPAEVYHADPAPEHSLSSTGAHTILKECPAIYLYQRQNREEKRAFDIGTAAHLMVLEQGLFEERVALVEGFTKDGKPSPGYKSDDAITQRTAAYAAGKTPLLRHEMEMMREMRAALWRDPIARLAFTDGQTEQSVFWQDGEYDVWRRSRIDYLPPSGRYAVNYKTSDSANPRDFERKIWDLGYHQRAAWEMDAVEAALGERPERYAFIVQMKKPPFLVASCWMDAEAIHYGNLQNRRAIAIFERCLRTNEWPGYRPDPMRGPAAFNVALPPWAMNQLRAQEDAGELEAPMPMERAA